MPDSSATAAPNHVELTSDIVSAYVSNNAVTRDELPALINAVHGALRGAVTPTQSVEELVPPVPINKTVRPDTSSALKMGGAISR